MKFIICISLVFLLISCSFNSFSECKKTFYFRNNEFGSYETGYNLPGINVDGNNQGAGLIYPVTIEKPQTEIEKLGIKIRINGSLGAVLKTLLVEKSEFSYIPYRYVKEKFTFSNPAVSNYVLEGKVADANQQIHTVRFIFPFTVGNKYITEEQGKKLIDAIEANAVNARNLINSEKKRGEEIALEYSTIANNKEMVDADKVIKDLTLNLDPIHKKVKTAKEQYDQVKEYTDKIEKQAKGYEKQYLELEEYFKKIDEQIKFNKELMERAKTDTSKETNVLLDTAISNSNNLVSKSNSIPAKEEIKIKNV